MRSMAPNPSKALNPSFSEALDGHNPKGLCVAKATEAGGGFCGSDPVSLAVKIRPRLCMRPKLIFG